MVGGREKVNNGAKTGGVMVAGDVDEHFLKLIRFVRYRWKADD